MESFVVLYVIATKSFNVKKTHFAPGYTEAHKATAGEAIEYAIQRREQQIRDIHQEVWALEQALEAVDADISSPTGL